MHDRYDRSTKVANMVKTWLYDGVDIIGLQEINSILIGYIGYIWLYYQIYRYVWSWLQRIIDLLMIIEGYILPVSKHDNTLQIQNIINEYNSINRQHQYRMVGDLNQSVNVSNGVVLIIKIPTGTNIEIAKSVNLPADYIHPSGLVYVKIGSMLITNVHFTPLLPNTTLLYRCVNFMNKITKYDVKSVQLNQIYILHTYILKLLTNTNDKLIAIGDFNIHKGFDMYNQIKLTLFIDTTSDNIIPTIHPLNRKHTDDWHIDYIFTNNPVRGTCLPIFDALDVSDHYPIIADVCWDDN